MIDTEQKPKIIVNEKTGIIEIDLAPVSLMIVPKDTAQIALQNVKITSDVREKGEKSVVLKDRKVHVVEPDKPKGKRGRKPSLSEYTIARIHAMAEEGKGYCRIYKILKEVPGVTDAKARHYAEQHMKKLRQMKANPVNMEIVDGAEDEKLRKFRIAEQRYKVNGAID